MTDTDSTTTPCWIYRSSKKEEMYLYLAKEENFEDVPDALMKR
ncbi:MAG: YcgL domain-containing protein, partial [Sedimenticola sp.]|nr:YcgL domain-containing protein [Sedimenticola sp.]